MSLIECLEKVVKSESLTSAKAHNGARIIELTEELTKGEVMRVRITQIPNSIRILAIRMGDNSGHSAHHLSWLQVKCSQICDYLLVFQSGARYYVTFIELKKSLSSARKKKACEQLMRSLPIWHYLASVCEIECGIKSLKPSIKYFLVAAKKSTRIDKPPTRVARSPERQRQPNAIDIKTVIGTEFPMRIFAC
ncbi:MAG: hypothetical protein OXU29_04685 [Gammaproteobacteria bacterium]|nr:hypothetical protein [Gammaproteobacteria bacterium]MDD9851118.1 hypothetical protein [Gammaproteobacteria bacterium]